MDQLRDKSETEASNPAARGDCAISVQNVNFAYRLQGGVRFDVLNGTNFTIPYGQSVGLVGRNASGKSTLLSIIRGFLVPDAGYVQIGSTTVSAKGHLVSRPKVSLISQRSDAGLAPTMTVFENYVLAGNHEMGGLMWAYSKRVKEQCRQLLSKARMGLEDKLKEQVRFLSGGQQQALSVLLAIEYPEAVLLLDEPTAALDPYAGERILDLALSEMKIRKGTVILVSHRLRDIAERCERVMVLQDGMITSDLNNADLRLTEKDLMAMMR
ncbi:MAG: ATP-binding cassette domain-containing protein [Proteobacteria bacterium]|nr:ATP-binding cassette domain-containing protein [Pseudomonadota bacterium]